VVRLVWTAPWAVGSVFWIELNLVSAPQLDAQRHEILLVETAQAIRPAACGNAVLYVEDNRANMELVAQLIARRPDLHLLRAEEATRGIALAREHQPDVILMDINLPGISGTDAMRILRTDPSTAHIPIIALSANAVPRDIQKGIEAGFFDYVTKPFKVQQLLDALDAALLFSQTHLHKKIERDTTP
jgi:CheY-like chemotaxis protein